MNAFMSLCAKWAGALSIFTSQAPSDPTTLKIKSLPEYEQAMYAQVRAKGGGGLMTGWETARTLFDYFREMGIHQYGMMSSLQSLIYGDGKWMGKPGTRWLEVGSGSGQAIEDFQRSYEAESHSVSHGVEVVAVEPNSSPTIVNGKFLGGRISVQSGEIIRGGGFTPNPNIHISTIPKFFEEVSDADLGKFALITSVRAATYYTPRLTFVLNKMLRARAQVNRTIFDVHSRDVVMTSGGEILLTTWLLDKLKPIVKSVEATESFAHPEVTFFRVSDIELTGPSGQLPELKFVKLDPHSGRRVFSE